MINLTQVERDKISQAVLDAEKLTTGEIVPMVVAQSDDYPGARWRLAIVVALLFGFLAYLSLNYAYPDGYDPQWILWFQIPGLYIGYGLGAFGAILRPFMLSSKIDEEVNQRALMAFYSHDLYATKERTAILIMVSLLERRVEILADTGINSKVAPDAWQGIVNDMIQRIKAESLTQGFCVAVRECGEVLAKEFPGSHDNPDELCNKIIIEE